MLETLDLDSRLPRKAYRESTGRLGLELAVLQRAARRHEIPVILLFEGWDAAGKGDSMGRLVDHLDPRGFRVHTTRMSTEEEALRPMLWKYWRRLPGGGQIAMFDRSWYFELTMGRLEGTLDRSTWERAISEINAFERQLTDGGTLIVKFWLHISRKEQKRRMKAWAKDPYQKWRTRQPLTQSHLKYKDILDVVEETLALTHTHNAPWVLVEAEDDAFRRVKVQREVAGAMQRALETCGFRAPTPEHPQESPEAEAPAEPQEDPLPAGVAIPPDSPLARVDLSRRLPRKRYQEELGVAQERLRELEFLCYSKRRAVVAVFEGWDAAGKGGAIKRLVGHLDPRGYDVIPVAAPSSEEATHHYLWRFWRRLPKDGHLAIFDRSWYGRVLVERVEGFCTETEWRRAYQEINEFERELVNDSVIVLKFWLHISPEEQLRRFRQREIEPRKRHKIVEEDWRNRAKFPAYLAAVDQMLRQPSTDYAPWTIIEAEDKLQARVRVLRTFIDVLEAKVADGDEKAAG